MKTIPIKILLDKQRNKVVFVEATKDFVDTLFSFLSLPLGTIVRLLATTNNNAQQQQQPQPESSPLLGRFRNLFKYFVDTLFSFLSLPHATINSNDQQQLSETSPFLCNINNLYKNVQNTTSNDVWNNPTCKEMLLHPKNPCEALCMRLFMNIDDTEPSSKFFVCDYCLKFTTFQNLHCTCGKPTNRQPWNLDSKRRGNRSSVDAQNCVFVRENGSMFMISDDLKIVPSSLVSFLEILKESGYSNLTRLEEVTHNIGKQEILNLLKYTLTSNEPLTNTILACFSKNRYSSPSLSASTVNVMPTNKIRSKMDVKVVKSKSQKKIIFAEANGDFVDFIFSFLTIPLGTIVKLLGENALAGCVGNLYKSVENLDSSLCTYSRSLLLNPGIAPQFGCPNQPLNIPDRQTPTSYYYKARFMSELDPRSLSRSKEGVVGFVKRDGLYCVGDDLSVKPLSTWSRLLYLKELSLSIPLDDLEVKLISIGEAEALSFLKALLTSKATTLTSGLGVLLNVPKQK